MMHTSSVLGAFLFAFAQLREQLGLLGGRAAEGQGGERTKSSKEIFKNQI